MDILVRPEKDIASCYHLWQDAIGRDWGLHKADFVRRLKNSTIYVAVIDDKIVGFAACEIDHNMASLQAIIVSPSLQRRGIGTLLLQQCFKDKTLARITLGSGGSSYFWPGVPKNLPGAKAFFSRQGYNFHEVSCDLASSPEMQPAKPVKGISFSPLTAEKRDATLIFEKTHFPSWLEFFEQTIQAGKYDNVLIAEYQNEIVGSVLVAYPDDNFIWSQQLGDDTGTFGALGVREDMRCTGIGLALASQATDILFARGAANIYVGWTWLVDWYGSLGYRVWREYDMGKIE